MDALRPKFQAPITRWFAPKMPSAFHSSSINSFNEEDNHFQLEVCSSDQESDGGYALVNGMAVAPPAAAFLQAQAASAASWPRLIEDLVAACPPCSCPAPAREGAQLHQLAFTSCCCTPVLPGLTSSSFAQEFFPKSDPDGPFPLDLFPLFTQYSSFFFRR